MISEFGSELKGFHFELVDKLRKALHGLQKHDAHAERLTFVIPGDLTIAYDIANHRFLCHDTCEFADPADLYCRQAVDCPPKWNTTTQRTDAHGKEGTTRTYLFELTGSDEKDDLHYNTKAEDYSNKFFRHELPYHKK